VVRVLTADDLPAELHDAPVAAGARDYAPRLLSEGGGLDAPTVRPLRAPAAVVGEGGTTWFVRTMGCYRAVESTAAGRVEVVAGDRRWVVTGPGGAGPGRWFPDELPKVTAANLACAVGAGEARCAQEEEGGCAVWRCRPDPGATRPPYEDPACAEVVASGRLEPVVERRFGGGSLSGGNIVPLVSEGTLGLYRVRPEAP
jgi:hypothetical protein